MKKILFTGVGTAVITPFDRSGQVDFDCFGKIIDAQIAGGVDALVVCGTTGESATMSHREKVSVIDYAVRRCDGKIPVIGGTGSNDTAASVELTAEVGKLGVAGVLCVTPYYNKTSQEGAFRHFSAIADCGVPVIVYNVPGRTGFNLKPETYARLSQHPYINAIKEANKDMAALAKTIRLCGGEINVYIGDDSLALTALALGALGVISVLSNVAPKAAGELCVAWFAGDAEKARRQQFACDPLIDALFCDVNPIPVKYGMSLLGFGDGGCRLPLCELNEENKARVKAEMQAAGLLS